MAEEKNFECSYVKCCAFCLGERLYPLDHVGTGVTYICCDCQRFTFVQPKPAPFPWGEALLLLLLALVFILLY